LQKLHRLRHTLADGFLELFVVQATEFLLLALGCILYNPPYSMKISVKTALKQR